MTDSNILADRAVGDLVSDDFRRARVFKNLGIEFCCGGGIPLAEACARKGIELDAVVAALGETDRDPESPLSRAASWTPTYLVDYIESVHHTFVRESVTALRAFTTKVARVHGHARPELPIIADRFEILAGAMEDHMAFEETELFPSVRRGEFLLAESLARAEGEHEEAGAIMAEIRTMSDGFTPPDWACRTYQAAFANLLEFEQDLHVHVHLENNVLFPMLREAAATN